MRKNRLITFLVAIFVTSQVFAQSIATGYTVGTWSGFRTAAATFTFDDDAPSHISVVAPEFDSRGYNATFNVVVNWMNQANQWTAFQKLAAKGHEIASHTVTHSENTPSSELSSSKTTINQKITGQDCNTIAYPYCNVPSDAAALAANYIGGRICDGQVMGKTPSDYFRISAITTGSEAGFASASNFTSSMQSAISKGGWVVFLTHGITGETNGNATYSPTPISAITGALDWAKENDSKVWVATFRDAILYAKERDALSLSEKTVSSTSYQLTASVNISSTVVTYDYPITVRRVMPASWKNIAVATGGKDIEVKTVTVGSTVYAQFDVVPGKTYSLEDRASEYTKEGPAVAETTLLNLLENGEFDEGTSYWDTQVGGDAKCTLTATTTAGMSGANAIQLCPNGNYGTENWHIQMYQNVELEGDVEYTLSFSAKASTARKLYVMVQKIAADYDTYLYKEYDLTTTAQNFEETLLTPSDVALDSKVTFCIGGSDGCVTIDNVFFGTEKSSNPGGGDEGGDKPSYSVDVTGDISKYFVDKAYIGPSCDVLDGETMTNGAYYTGEYTNLFVKYLGKTEAQVQAKMKSVWDHFYTVGGPNTVYYEAGKDENGKDMAYIYDTGNQDVRTEGQSYGLMICVQMGDREKFDRLWRWAKKYMQYKAGDVREGLFAWQCETNGSIKGASSAPDGEMYFLTALFFASHRWGNDGDINYEEEAQYLAKCLLNKTGRGNGQVSPLFNKSNYLVTFGETSYDFSDPSYNLPGFLELWARWINTNTDFWAKTPKAARDLLYNSAHKITGLYPDYCNFDGSGYYPNWAGYNTSIYKYDAIRCPMNVGMDYHWFAADSRQETMMYNILNFFKSDGYSHAFFNVDGTGADGYYSEGQKGGNGVGVFALTPGNEALAKENLQKLWDVTPPTGQWRYYNGMVYMLSMLHATGNFRIFKPTPEVVVETLSGPSPVEFNGEEYTKDTTFKTLIDCKIYDVTITIEESSSSFNVIFEDYDGTELKTEVVESGASATAPDEPTRTGYTFKEWDTDFSNVTEDLTVKAVYEINTYTVTFVDFDGTTIDEQTIEYGSDAVAPTEPTREGYDFDGWDVAFTSITKDLTVTATYTEKVAQTTLKYEAENATGSGTTTANSSAASGGKYVKMQSGDLTFNVNVEKAGVYDITVAYSLTEDYKAQNLVVNGVQAGTLAFDKSGSTNPTFATIVAAAALEAGANTIAITKSWGWVDIDYIELSTHESVKFNIDANPVVANPTSGAVELYDFLKKNFGKKTISGVMTLDMPSNNSFKGQYDVSYIHDKSGKYTALVGFDFMQSVGKGTEWATNYTKTMIDITKELWNEGGIPYYTWHWRDPTKATTSFNTSEASFKLSDAFTDASCTKWNTNSTIYKGIIADLDVIAKHLLDLQEAGVAVLWRPLHEASGKWFWWGGSGAQPYKQLYYLLFDKLTNEYGLHNLIWVWNSDGTDADWYPGDNYVDIAGRDFYYQAPNTYNHSSLVTEFESVAKVVDGKKIVTLAECGAVPYPQNMEDDGAMWSWFMPWYDEGSTKYVSSDDHNKVSDWNLIMNDERVITLEDMPGWGSLPVENTYTVTFVDFDGTVLDEQIIEEGSAATAPTEPTREGYVFAGWDKTFDNVIEDITITATYTVQSFTVTFVDYDGSTLETQTVEYGKDAVAPKDPTREGYTFSAWEGSYENVIEDVTITATYVAKGKADYSALNKAIADAEALDLDEYTVTTIKALQDALTAAKAVDADLFVEDQAIVDAATKALTDAIGALAVQSFTVTFVDYDGSTIETQTVEYGKDAVAPKDPTREGYTFSAWEGSYENVTADVTITATYVAKDKADYSALNKAIADAEAINTTGYTATTTKALQDALTAAKAVDSDLLAEDQAIVDAATKALTDAIGALAVQSFTVTFVDYDGSTLGTQTVEYGKDAVAPKSPTREGYTFSAWEGSYENVIANVTITAVYTEKGKADYSALNKAIADAEALNTTGYTAATTKALQDALTAAKSVDKNLLAEDQQIVDNAVKALQDALNGLVKQSFTVTFIVDGKTVDSQVVEYGQSAKAPVEPTKLGYIFDSWDASFSNVIDNISVNAVFVVQTFTVTFTDFNGKTIDEQTVEYGGTAVEPTIPKREGYDFVGWIGSFENVTANVTITASYKAKAKANYTELDAAIASTDKLKQSLYSSESWSQLQKALEKAQSVDRDLLEADQTIVDNAAQMLNNAISDLEVVDRTKLASSISKANSLAANAVEGYNRGQYPVGAKTTLADAIAKANTVYEKVSVSQSELDKANEELIAAMEQFKASVITADKTFLAMAINNATAALTKAEGNTGSGSGQYPALAVTTLENELASAQEIYKNATEQSIIDTKTQVLNAAVQAFLSSVNPITVDFAELSTLIAEATELLSTTSVGENGGQYGLLECMELSRSKQTAERMLSDSKVTQKDVDKQVVLLQKAIDAYRASQVLAADVIDATTVQIYTKSHIVVVENANNAIAVYDIKGRLVSLLDKESANDSAEIYIAKNGVYIVKIGSIAQQIVIQ